MIKVTADIFSGRPNPEWVVSGVEAQLALRSLSQQPAAAAALDSGFQGLGSRGLIVNILNDHSASEHGVPASFRLAGGGTAHESHARETAERLIASLTAQGAGGHPAIAAEPSIPLNDDLKRFILDGLPAGQHVVTWKPEQSGTMDKAFDFADLENCGYETAAFNPGFWNDPTHITRNNCYNYASNRRTDTFAQPGRASGHLYALVNCAEVGNGAVSDGGTFSCAPDSQKNRWYMALVIAPGPGFVDFHWYSKAAEGFWGHKPGGTAARNHDNSGPGHLVTDPRTANRGPYTIFCRFMYAQAKMVVG